MEKLTRRRYTLEYKQEAVRLVTSGQKVAVAAKALGIVEQTLANWVKAEKVGQLRGVKSEQVSSERMENIRFDPRDMGEVRVFYKDRFLCPAVSAELAGRRSHCETSFACATNGDANSRRFFKTGKKWSTRFFN
jgi:transposase